MSDDHTRPLLSQDGSLQSTSPSFEKVEEDDDGGVRLCRCCPCDCLPWTMLLLICFLTFGSYWVFDTPGAIFTQLQGWFGDDYTSSDNLNLYSIYSWPNTVLALFGGFLIDRVTGVRNGALLFCGLILLGQIIFCLGVQWKYYWVCFFGRFVFGLGGENLTVAQNAYTVRWFDGPFLALAFGLVVAFARIGTSVNFVVTPLLANMDNGVPISVWFGAAMCAVSGTAAIIAYFIDWFGEPRIAAKKAKALKGKPEQLEEIIKFSDITTIPMAAWLLFFICLFFYIGVLTFYTVASDIMQNTGNYYSDDTATMYISIPNFLSIAFSPLFGRMVDRYGKALTFTAVASCMMIVAHFLFLALANEWFLFSPIPIMVWLGIGYSLGAASLWPTVGCVVEPKVLGTAYGCMTAVQNLGLAVFPMVIGYLQDAPSISGTTLQYTLPILIFIGCEVTALILTLILIGVDRKRHNGIMNASAEARAKMKDEEPTEVIVETPKDVVWEQTKSPTSTLTTPIKGVQNERQPISPPTGGTDRLRDTTNDLSRSPFLGTQITRSSKDGSYL